MADAIKAGALMKYGIIAVQSPDPAAEGAAAAWPGKMAGVLALVRRAKDRDAKAWEELFKRFTPDLLGMAARLMLPHRPGESVSHVLGDVWQRGWKGIAKFRGAAEARDDETAGRILLAWLRQVVRTAYLNDVVRPAARQPLTVPVGTADPDSSAPPGAGWSPTDSTPSVGTRVIDREDQDRLRQALDTLSDDDRELILRLHSGEKSIRKIADEMGCPERTLRDRRDRIIKQLRSVMKWQVP